MDAIVANAKSVEKFLEHRDLSSLQLNARYHILGMRYISTQFGRSVVVDLEETGGVCPQQDDEKNFMSTYPSGGLPFSQTNSLRK